MRFAAWPDPGRPWEDLLATARQADTTGWDSVYFADHFMPNGAGPQPGPTHECWAVMAAFAAVTERVRLGTLVCGNTYRHPAVLASTAATVDHVSGGRLLLGMGAGWQQNEHEAYGIEFGTFGERFDKLEESLQIILGLLREERTTFAGKHYQVTDAPCEPKPVQERLPLMVGGTGERRTLALVARFADEWNMWGSPDDCRAKAEVLARRCEEVGRDPSTIARSAQSILVCSEDPKALEGLRGRPGLLAGTPDEIAEVMAGYAAAGIDEFIFPTWMLREPAQRTEAMDLFIERVAPQLR